MPKLRPGQHWYTCKNCSRVYPAFPSGVRNCPSCRRHIAPADIAAIIGAPVSRSPAPTDKPEW